MAPAGGNRRARGAGGGPLVCPRLQVLQDCWQAPPSPIHVPDHVEAHISARAGGAPRGGSRPAPTEESHPSRIPQQTSCPARITRPCRSSSDSWSPRARPQAPAKVGVGSLRAASALPQPFRALFVLCKRHTDSGRAAGLAQALDPSTPRLLSAAKAQEAQHAVGCPASRTLTTQASRHLSRAAVAAPLPLVHCRCRRRRRRPAAILPSPAAHHTVLPNLPHKHPPLRFHLPQDSSCLLYTSRRG